MKVKLQISGEYTEPEAEIRADRMSAEVEDAVEYLQSSGRGRIVPVYAGEKLIVLRAADIYVVRVENEKTVLYTRERSYVSGRRLYELQKLLGKQFMRVSKSALVNLDELDHAEAALGGMMLLTMRNGSREYVSRHYLPELRRYLGL